MVEKMKKDKVIRRVGGFYWYYSGLISFGDDSPFRLTAPVGSMVGRGRNHDHGDSHQ